MKTTEKFDLIANAIKGNIQLEMYCRNTWNTMTYDKDGQFFDQDGNYFRISELLDRYDIRVLDPNIPELSYEESEFLRHFPQDWWIVRSKYGRLYIHDHKPMKNIVEGEWEAEGCYDDIPKGISLLFADIRWSNNDCYTIGELRKV
jgi:hypothetical protein